ncbi:MAG TPA: hypothetical protein DDZ83_09335 [Nitrospinae bacterium]|nr:hypothetical protein [Nitrospinota bacterium]
MPFEMVALVPAFLFSLSSVLTRQGMDGSTPHTGSLVVLIFNFAAFLIALTVVDFSRIQLSWHWMAFIGAGIASPALSLLFMYRSIFHIGVAPTNSIVISHAFFGPFFAFFLLGERPAPSVWAGIAIVICGVWILMGGSSLRNQVRHLWLPVMSAICFGLAHNLRKIGFMGMDSLLFGGFLQAASAAALAPFILKAGTRGQACVFNRKSLRYFLLAGLAMVGALFSLLYALRGGQVSLIGPILASAPLFALFLTHTMLGGKEKITLRITGGACLIVFGVVMVTLLR